jgi:phytoene/squalene synthetase
VVLTSSSHYTFSVAGVLAEALADLLGPESADAIEPETKKQTAFLPHANVER